MCAIIQVKGMLYTDSARLMEYFKDIFHLSKDCRFSNSTDSLFA